MKKSDIEAKRTERGGFTRATLAEWGVPWPPPKGWKRNLMNRPEPTYNKEIDQVYEDMAMFIEVVAERIDELEKKVEQLQLTVKQ